MVIRATAINPELLRWARERAGYSVEDIARRRRVSPERVREWESGQSFPTWKQFKQMAYHDYHRGTVFFFFKDPPEEKTVTERFHRLPAAMLEDLHPDTLYAVRQARYRQDDLAELLGPGVSGERFILRDLRGQADAGNPSRLAVAVREYLGLDPNDPEGFSNRAGTFEDFRSLVEDAGVWVFKRSFRQKDVAGLCLRDDTYPVIYVGNGQGAARQIFTLFNGLAHLLFDFNYLGRTDRHFYLTCLSGEDQAIERACIQFAVGFQHDSEQACRLSINGHSEAAIPAGNKDIYYATQAADLGQKYLRAAFLAFEERQIEESDLSIFLGVKGWHLDGLERYAWQ